MNTCLGTYITILCKGVGRSSRGRVKGQEKDKRIARCVKQRQNLFQSINTSTDDYPQESSAIAEKLSWSLGYIDRARTKSAKKC